MKPEKTFLEKLKEFVQYAIKNYFSFELNQNDKRDILKFDNGQIYVYDLGGYNGLDESISTSLSLQSIIKKEQSNLVYNDNAKSFSDGLVNIANGEYSHATGKGTTTEGIASFTCGNADTNCEIIAKGTGSFAGGYCPEDGIINANGEGSFAFGCSNDDIFDLHSLIAWGKASHAEGIGTWAMGEGSHSEGYNTIAKGNYSHASGSKCVAYGSNSFAIGESTHANQNMLAIGQFNEITDNEENCKELFAVGYGKDENNRQTICKIIGKNENDLSKGILYVNDIYCDNIHVTNSEKPKNNEYNEYFDWDDIEENGKYKFVTLKNNKIVLASSGDDILGITKESNNENALVGFIGTFIIEDDGTCILGKRCKVTNGGIATHSRATTNGYKVLSRIDNTHIKILASFI